MNEFKKAIKENMYLIIFLIIILIVLIVIAVVRHIEGKKMYDGQNIDKISMPEIELTNQGVNEYKVIRKDYNDLISAYYKDFIYLLADDPEAAYEKIDDGAKETYYGNKYEDFLKTRNFLNNKYIKNNTIKGYRVNENGTTRKITIIDSASKKYIFYENGIWNYKVTIIGDTNEDIIPRTTEETSN